jgi:hypothetical protein
VRAVINEEIDVIGDRGRWLAMVNAPAEDGDLETFQGYQP